MVFQGESGRWDEGFKAGRHRLLSGGYSGTKAGADISEERGW